MKHTTQMDMSNRKVLVTGAASGIGLACTEILLSTGAQVFLSDVNEALLEQEFQRLAREYETVYARQCDLRDSNAVDTLVTAASTTMGGLDGLVASAGVHDTKPFLDLTIEDVRRVNSVNFDGTFTTVQAAGREMLASSNAGSMVLLSSAAGRLPRALASHYAASKAAVLSLVKSAAEALGPTIRVNGICPGSIRTAMFEKHVAARNTELGQQSGRQYIMEATNRSMLRRLGEPVDIAHGVLFLLSDHAGFITGQSINIDGGVNLS